MSLPANLSYFLSRMQGVSANRFKIYPNNTGTATPNKIVRFELPSNSLLNLKSLQMMFSASTTGTNAGGRLPPRIDSLIERVAVYAGGVLLSHGFNAYNVLQHAKAVYHGEKLNSVTGHTEARRVSYVDGLGSGTNPNHAPGTENEGYPSTTFAGTTPFASTRGIPSWAPASPASSTPPSSRSWSSRSRSPTPPSSRPSRASTSTAPAGTRSAPTATATPRTSSRICT